jgi:GNAT superfamily N-acetyltransferase
MFGCDASHTGNGAGTALLQRICGIADAERVEVFVEANKGAVSFYQRHGFEVRQELTMPGELKYVEVMMFRPIKST